MAFCICTAACQGELKLSGSVTAPPDMTAAPINTTPATLGFANIYGDMETLGCTLSACHGGATPAGNFSIQPMASSDMTKLMANYTTTKVRVNTSSASMSLLLLKLQPTGQGGTPHTGGNMFFPNTSNSMYKNWLLWIQLGAPYDPVPTGAGTVDMAGGGG
jgi:hypothetical protein